MVGETQRGLRMLSSPSLAEGYVNEKRKTKNENKKRKTKTKNEKRKTKNEKQKTKNTLTVTTQPRTPPHLLLPSCCACVNHLTGMFITCFEAVFVAPPAAAVL